MSTNSSSNLAPQGDKSNTVAHTPGKLPPAPWHVDPDDRPDMEWNNHICSADGNTVCFMAHNPDDNTALENAARLIASAPDLLEALKAMLARYVSLAGSGDCGFWDPESENEVIAARSAIQRAEGGQ